MSREWGPVALAACVAPTGASNASQPTPLPWQGIAARSRSYGHAFAGQKKGRLRGPFLHWMVEVGGIEPPSEGTPSPVLHA